MTARTSTGSSRALHQQLERHRRWRGRRAVTDVPLELLIIIIILAIVVPIIVAALIAYTSDQEYLGVTEQAAAIRDVAIQTFDDGINTTLLVQVSMPGGATLTAGGPIFLCCGPPSHLNYQAAYLNYWIGNGGQKYNTQVDNGGQNILLTNITCNNGVFQYNTFYVSPGTSTLALTKIAPGAFFCGLPAPTNMTTGFVEVQTVP